MARLTRGAALALAACALWAPAASAAPSQESMFMDDTHLAFGSAQELETTMATLRGLGVDRVRVSVFWGSVAPNGRGTARPQFGAGGPSDPAAYPPGSWDRYDRLVQAAQRYGIGVHFNITGGAPYWATADPSRQAPMLDPSRTEFRDFVIAVGRRYSGTYVDERPTPAPPPPEGGGGGGLPPLFPRGAARTAQVAPGTALPRVSFWSIWNEPNQPGWLRPQVRGRVPSSPHIYRELQDAGYAGLVASGHARDTYLLGETAPRGSSRLTPVSPMRPLLFVRELYCLNRKLRPLKGRAAAARGCPADRAGRRRFAADHPGLFAASGWAHHPYGLEVRPNKKDPVKDQVTISVLPRLTKTLDRIQRRYGKRRRYPVWLTEYGYQTDPPDRTIGVSWRRQAAYLNEAEEIAYRNRRVRSLTQFLLVDDGPNREVPPSHIKYWGSTFQSGLVSVDGRRKPAFLSYQRTINVTPARARKGRRLRVFGQLRPAAPGARLQARIEFRRKGARRYRRLRTVTTRSLRNYLSARIKAPGTGLIRLAWRDPAGSGTLHSRSVPVKRLKR